MDRLAGVDQAGVDRPAFSLVLILAHLAAIMHHTRLTSRFGYPCVSFPVLSRHAWIELPLASCCVSLSVCVEVSVEVVDEPRLRHCLIRSFRNSGASKR